MRYAFWFPYPKMAVAELRPPEVDQTFWDFKYMDPLVDDFLRASKGHPSVFSFSTIPQWMFTTPKPVVYPEDPGQVFWDYSQGTELANVQALADYYARLAGWYTQGGFTDELGKFHASGHHFDIGYWEVFNEIDGEHDTRPQQYVERYDAIAQAVLKVAPSMKFVALAFIFPVLVSANVLIFSGRDQSQAGRSLGLHLFSFLRHALGRSNVGRLAVHFF